MVRDIGRTTYSYYCLTVQDRYWLKTRTYKKLKLKDKNGRVSDSLYMYSIGHLKYIFPTLYFFTAITW